MKKRVLTIQMSLINYFVDNIFRINCIKISAGNEVIQFIIHITYLDNYRLF
jgi:hypothetical protein